MGDVLSFFYYLREDAAQGRSPFFVGGAPLVYIGSHSDLSVTPLVMIEHECRFHTS